VAPFRTPFLHQPPRKEVTPKSLNNSNSIYLEPDCYEYKFVAWFTKKGRKIWAKHTQGKAF